MNIEQKRWTEAGGWEPGNPGDLGDSAQLVLLFGNKSILQDRIWLAELKQVYPNAHLLGCSTAGEIYGTQVSDDSLVVTAVSFEYTQLKGTKIKIDKMENSFQVGQELARSLEKKDLAHVFVLSDGLKINGSELVKGLIKHLPEHTSITGGLSGDGALFRETYVLWDDEPEKDTVAVLGLYGKRLRVGYASFGGWDPFGPERLITRSKGNVLYELDGKSALMLYKKYLGEHAKGLPSTGLLFPLSIRIREGERGVVRTILSVNEEDQSMTFAGDVPEGAYARLMKANFDRLIDGAVTAAKTSLDIIGFSPELAVLISCVGRKLILKQRIEEEIEGVRDILGAQATLTGFYSYGEISPFTKGAQCELHNQTMTITAFSEG
ncbi:MAG TPA: FIST N-terminal domain-containing protein [Syntrophales bacterium]|nr:FIST N-terminal domain-containing protein [Syntrophales bacterium]